MIFARRPRITYRCGYWRCHAGGYKTGFGETVWSAFVDWVMKNNPRLLS